ncbi:MAG: ATP-binding protein [Paludibacter sp.]|nr:ATP-binding protein [Paludibacter sp.]
MAQLIGRKHETDFINTLLIADNSDFIVVYGRRRIGKTFLIREHFNNSFDFQLTGLANATIRQQLKNFDVSLAKYSKKAFEQPKTWFDAFQQLIEVLEKNRKRKKVVFLDEMPWMDTPKSDFISALEHFWNSWASARNDILLIVCGSATSWINNKLINNKGGLHNRVTRKIKLEPFTLSECETYLQKRNIHWTRHQLIECYMIVGGVPYYLSLMQQGLSLAQNIDRLLFVENGMLRNEFDNLYASLFRNADNHIKIIETLSRKNQGFSRDELLQSAGLPNSGWSTKILDELESSGFIRRYVPLYKKRRDSFYQLSDYYSMFYYRFIATRKINDKQFWSNTIDSASHRAWSGFAFEQVCMSHIEQIKVKLGISGIKTTIGSWRKVDKDGAAQIDLLIDRNDQVINLCEMKYAGSEFVIDKKYDIEMRKKIAVFKHATNCRKAVYLTMITTYGLKQNEYALGLVQNQLTMNDLF